MKSRWQLSVRTYWILTVIACFFIAAIIFTGASVRVTGSGLGCPTWPKCTSDSFTPHDSMSGHALIEFGNRLFTGAVSLSVILAVAGSLIRYPRSKKLIWLSLTLVAGVVAQIILGGITVLLDLHPLAVGSHMLLSIILLTFAMILAVVSKQEVPPSLKPLLKRSPQLLVLILTSIVVVLGVVVTAAGPHAGDETVPRLDVSIVTAARFHSLSAWVLLAAVIHLLFVMKDKSPSLRALFGIILLQGAWGYTQYALSVPAWMVAIHVLLATILFVFSTLYWMTSLQGPTLQEPTTPQTVPDRQQGEQI